MMKSGNVVLFASGALLGGLAPLAFPGWWQPGAQAGLFKLTLTPESLTVLLSGLLAILFDWFPGLATRFDSLSKLKKQQVMIVLLTGIVGFVFAGSCRGLFETGLACSPQSLPQLLEYILTAAGVNQAVHLLTKPGPQMSHQ